MLLSRSEFICRPYPRCWHAMSAEALSAVGVIATVVAALVAVLTLGWQMLVHRGRAHVKSTYAMPYFENPRLYPDDFVEIAVKNVGGKPLTVTNYAVGLNGRKPGSNMWVTRPPAWATRLPSVVDPGGVPTKLLVPVSELRKAHESLGVPFSKMVPWVELADGRKVYSTNSVPLRS